jgi:aminopeptidase-like protein
METTEQIAAYFDRLWPLHRSLTGVGVQQTLDILSELLPLQRLEIPSGTPVFDWVVPKEWLVRAAYVVTPAGEKILDVQDNNLHLLNYSAPFRGRMTRAELDQHLYSLPEQPTAIPYVTSYYQPRWGFCLAHQQRQALPEGEYEVVIDTEFLDGSLTLAEAILPGSSGQEVLISTYICHPSLANNELSGPLVAAFLYRRLAQLADRRLTYRFVFLPETIGSIAYLQQHGQHFKEKLVAGYVVTCAGDRGPFTFKRSRRGQSVADRAAEYVLKKRFAGAAKILDFFPAGSDERQYCSPGFNLPVGSIMRTMYGCYPEYHTSLDNRDFISFDALQESIDVYAEVCSVLEHNRIYRNRIMYGEPNLGKRGLYPTVGAAKDTAQKVAAMMWFLNLADGAHDQLAIAERSKVDFQVLNDMAGKCLEAGLVELVAEL